MTKNTRLTDLTKNELLEMVFSCANSNPDKRTFEITKRLVEDTFNTIYEMNISPDEFWAAIDWLTRLCSSGQIGLITAGLGYDRLLDIIQDEQDIKNNCFGGTPRAIEGPLYIPGSPLCEYEARLDDGKDNGELFVMEGKVLDASGNPLKGAIVDVWHANSHGLYSHFDSSQSKYNLRRRIKTDSNGCYRFRSILPPGYSIPEEGPVAELFRLLDRHGNRPAHVHFMVSAPGMRTLTTQINLPDDPYLNNDFAFATRENLVVNLENNIGPEGYETLGIEKPFTRAVFDFILQKSNSKKDGIHGGRNKRALEQLNKVNN